MRLIAASERKPYIKAIIYGPSGAGKTTLAVSGHDTPGLGPVLVVDIEEGTISAAHTSAIVTDKIETKEHIDEVLLGFKHKRPEYQKFNTIVIDTGTRLQMVILDHCIRKTIKKRSQTRDIDDVHLKDWGDCGKVMRRIIGEFLALDKHVIILAHSRDIYPNVPEGAPPKPPTDTVPDFTPALSKTLRGYADYVWYLKEHEGDRYLMTSPPKDHTIIRVKTRGHKFAGLLGGVIKNPSLAEIYGKLKQSVGQD